MYDGGYRPDRGFSKCSRVVGDVMGQYHPHGDSAIYDTLVRLAQPWSLRYPLVDGQGNFGSPGNDPAAAMRYCVTGDTLVATPDGQVAIVDLLPGAAPHTTTDVDLKVLGRDGSPVAASAFHHSGLQHTLRMRTVDGATLTGSRNHPVLCLVDVLGVPTLLWKLLGELQPGDTVAVLRAGAPLPIQVAVHANTRLVDAFARRDDVSDAERRAVLEPLSDGRYTFLDVADVEDAGLADVYSLRVDTDDHAFVTNGFVSHNTECRMAPLAMEMVRDIDKDTVDFAPNYDGRTQEPTVLPSRFPNLLVNGSSGIAVGMATNIPTAQPARGRRGRPVAAREPRGRRRRAARASCCCAVKGPDFPTRGLIMGTRGIEEAYRTGRGPITMRAVVEVEEIQGRTCLVVTELPYQVNPDNLKMKIAELVDCGRVAGYRRPQRRHLGQDRPADRHRPQAGRRREGRAQQPLQAHPAAGHVRREHARARRRRPAHAEPGQVRPLLGRPPDRGHRPPDPVPARRGRAAGPHLPRLRQGARRARRGHRADPQLAVRRGGPRRA